LIRTDAEYQKSLRALEAQRKSIEEKKQHFEQIGLTPEQVEKALEPLWAYYHQIEDEVKYYEKVKKGEFPRKTSLDQLGRMLISYRIYKGITQTELAERLGVSNAQVSRDERNEYHGASIEKLKKVADALGVPLVIVPKEVADEVLTV
jgi:DNA-directed RNA polymerase specialized sigma subunit